MNRKQRDKMRAKLEQLERAGGGVLTPDAVVAEARSPKSVLHRMFEWDDSKAAHAHRLDQARQLIASVRYVYTVEEHRYSAPKYVPDPNKERASDQGYVSLPRLRSDDELAREALLNEFSRCSAHLERAYAIARALEFAPEEVRALRDSVGVLVSRVSSTEHRTEQ